MSFQQGDKYPGGVNPTYRAVSNPVASDAEILAGVGAQLAQTKAVIAEDAGTLAHRAKVHAETLAERQRVLSGR